MDEGEGRSRRMDEGGREKWGNEGQKPTRDTAQRQAAGYMSQPNPPPANEEMMNRKLDPHAAYRSTITGMASQLKRYALGIIPLPKRLVMWVEHMRGSNKEPRQRHRMHWHQAERHGAPPLERLWLEGEAPSLAPWQSRGTRGRLEFGRRWEGRNDIGNKGQETKNENGVHEEERKRDRSMRKQRGREDVPLDERANISAAPKEILDGEPPLGAEFLLPLLIDLREQHHQQPKASSQHKRDPGLFQPRTSDERAQRQFHWTGSGLRVCHEPDLCVSKGAKIPQEGEDARAKGVYGEYGRSGGKERKPKKEGGHAQPNNDLPLSPTTMSRFKLLK
ncbi:hypothetical protein B0H19DRAFT_1321962 [Mycena capillaripes]|nr:hypothetical protein B0H19DRAFT_1321962 [Mycena capillaripes]